MAADSANLTLVLLVFDYIHKIVRIGTLALDQALDLGRCFFWMKTFKFNRSGLLNVAAVFSILCSILLSSNLVLSFGPHSERSRFRN